jgi:hypothetical protein
MKSIRWFLRTVFANHTKKNARSNMNENFWHMALHYGVDF